MVLICHNADLADGWECVDDHALYAKEYSEDNPHRLSAELHSLLSSLKPSTDQASRLLGSPIVRHILTSQRSSMVGRRDSGATLLFRLLDRRITQWHALPRIGFEPTGKIRDSQTEASFPHSSDA